MYSLFFLRDALEPDLAGEIDMTHDLLLYPSKKLVFVKEVV